MSIQFGRWNFDGKPVDRDYLEKVKPLLTEYGPDDMGCYTKGDIAILHCAFHTTSESPLETQPHVTSSNSILAWDGRLDNRRDLIQEHSRLMTEDSTDIELVAAAFETHRDDCFKTLLGDWALSIWAPFARSLLLARDPLGGRPLYYSLDETGITWSTILDPLLLFREKAFELSETYMARWIASFPDACLTPYVGIECVPPGSTVRIRQASIQATKWWDFDPRKSIRYRLDSDYEEHFRIVFYEAVRRRLRSRNTILAELSGGMDSSSIVCVADALIGQGAAAGFPELDTLSYFDDSEPNWDEKTYFKMVEAKRGRIGCHIDVSSEQYFELDRECVCFPAIPAAAGHSRGLNIEFTDWLKSRSIRVLLSGIGGDEVLGGVPTPIPELADLIVGAEFRRLGRQLKAWSLHKRKPWFLLLFETVNTFLPRLSVSSPILPWLQPGFTQRNWLALAPPCHRNRLSGPRPSFQMSLDTLEGLRNQLACVSTPTAPLVETRFPFLDRSLLEFLCAIPREQFVRPGQRRSLMRRAMKGIVPDQILNRRRKASLRRPLIAATTDWPEHLRNSGVLLVESLGVVNGRNLIAYLQEARGRSNVPIVPLIRLLSLERWLRSLALRKILPTPLPPATFQVTSGESRGA